MKKFKSILLLMLVISLVLMVFQNQAPWPVRFLWMTGQIPGIVLLFIAITGGFIIGVITMLLAKSHANNDTANRNSVNPH